jgi:hypothetical protein
MKCDWDRHIHRPKHIFNVDGNDGNNKKLKKTYFCPKCDKQFMSHSGLWKHSKICETMTVTNITNTSNTFTEAKPNLFNADNTRELVEYLIKENAEFKQLLLEQNKQMAAISSQAIQNAGHNNTINNNINNNFNLQVYLNETCKNAINMTDFVEQLNVTVDDLEETGRLGFAEGISKIFINGLKRMSVSDRPLHCTDAKREVVYIKDKNEWNKEADDKPMLLTAIKNVSKKNIGQIFEWVKTHPEYNDSSSKQSDKYLKIVSESMSGSTEEECDKNYNKIIKNIVKQTVIDKNSIINI